MLTLSSNNSACVAPRTVLLLTATLFLVLTRSAGSYDLRSWSDTSETVTFRAQYISSKRGWVNIKREDGGLGRVPLKWLSASDQDYVQQATVNADVSRQTPSPTAVENSPRKKPFLSRRSLVSICLHQAMSTKRLKASSHMTLAACVAWTAPEPGTTLAGLAWSRSGL